MVRWRLWIRFWLFINSQNRIGLFSINATILINFHTMCSKLESHFWKLFESTFGWHHSWQSLVSLVVLLQCVQNALKMVVGWQPKSSSYFGNSQFPHRTLIFSRSETHGSVEKCIFLCEHRIHTIRKVNFLSKNSILTKPQHFHEFFTQFFFDNFSREIKVVNS